jgi:hypothetical protein
MRFPVPVSVPVCVPVLEFLAGLRPGWTGTKTGTAAGATSPSRSCVPVDARRPGRPAQHLDGTGTAAPVLVAGPGRP